MKPKHKRLLGVLMLVACVSAGAFILLDKFRDNLIYFYPPKDIAKISSAEPERLEKIMTQEIRVGGMVKTDSYRKGKKFLHNFTVTDYENDLRIRFNGILPPMFREGQGVVAQGHLRKGQNENIYFEARTLLTKHDEKYMPPELKKLKQPAKP